MGPTHLTCAWHCPPWISQTGAFWNGPHAQAKACKWNWLHVGLCLLTSFPWPGMFSPIICLHSECLWSLYQGLGCNCWRAFLPAPPWDHWYPVWWLYWASACLLATLSSQLTFPFQLHPRCTCVSWRTYMQMHAHTHTHTHTCLATHTTCFGLCQNFRKK